MKRVFVLGAVALVASCVFAQDAFAQRGRGTVEAAYAHLLPDMLAVRDCASSYAPAGVITRTLITRTCPTCQLELLHSLFQVMQGKSTAAGVGTGTIG
jgi:hypothetical protein